MRTLSQNLKVSQVINPAVYSTDQTSSAIDMKGYDSLMLLAAVGNAGDTWSSTDKVELEVQHSDDDSSYSACADADIQDAVTGTNTGTFGKLVSSSTSDNQVYKCSYVGGKRYVKVVVNFSGTHSTGSPVGVVAVQGHALAKPVA